MRPLVLVLSALLTACGGEALVVLAPVPGDGAVPVEADAAGRQPDAGVLAPGPDAGQDGEDAGGQADSGLAEDAGGESDAGVEADAGLEPDAGLEADAGFIEDAGEPDAGLDPCPAGRTCVDAFPFTDYRDTAQSSLSAFDSYACRPNTNEGGPEIVFQVEVPADGFLSVAVYEEPGVDVDVHLLGSLDPSDCLDRGNLHARADVTAGTWFVVVDTYVASGVPQSGAFRLDIGFVEPSRGPCEMQVGEMPRVGDGGDHLPMPATGPVVLEAHLVTQEEPRPYPMTPTEELADHYELSQSRTGFVMHRGEEWAPLEGGDHYGCGIGSPSLFPVLDEAWYVNMYWTSAARPARSTRMIIRKPGTSRAVVVSAGFETGPGNLQKIGGTPEETFFYLGGDPLWTFGIAVDQSLPLGPRVCE